MIEKFSDLSDRERRYLAMHATYRANQETDVRYWEKDPMLREELHLRWLEIANALHVAPWSA